MAASTTESTPWPLLQRLEEANLVGLADAMGISVSTASRMVHRLVAAHWVRRVPSPSNRREVAVSLTAGGHRILEHYDDLRLLAVHQCLDAAAPAVRTSLVEALRSVLPGGEG